MNDDVKIQSLEHVKRQETKDVPLTNTLAMANHGGPALSVDMQRFCGRILKGESEAYAREHVGITSETLSLWKQSPDFRLAFESASKYRSAMKRSNATQLAEEHSAYLMAETISIGYDSKHDRDRLSAQSLVYKAAGVLNDNSSINVQVNVDQSAKAYMSSQQDDTPKT